MNLENDLKTIFENHRYESFTRSDLVNILVEYYGYTYQLKFSDLSKALRKLKKEGFVFTYGRKWEKKGGSHEADA